MVLAAGASLKARGGKAPTVGDEAGPVPVKEQTFLQSLTESERNALLRGAKIFLEDAKGPDSEASSFDEHVRRLDALKEVLDIDIGMQTAPRGGTDARPAGSKRAPTSSSSTASALSRDLVAKPLDREKWSLEAEKDAVHEAARLRVKGSALKAEVDALRSHTRRLAEHMAKAKQMHSQAMVENRHQQLKQARESAGRIADLEEQLGRHREALAELASQAEGLANDNSLLSTEVATLRDQKALLEEQVAAVEERSKSLQTMYLAQLEDYRRTVTAHDARRDRILDGLATKEVLALSKPPEDYPVPVGPPPMDVAFMLGENAALRRRLELQDGELKKLRGELGMVTEQRDRLEAALRKDRSVAQTHAGKMQSRLIGAVRRLEYLTESDAAKGRKLEERDKYINKLEAEVVRHHQVVSTLTKRVQRLEAARRAGARDDGLDNEAWMTGLPEGVVRQIHGATDAWATSGPGRASPRHARQGSRAVEAEPDVQGQAAAERLQSHIMQLLHPQLSLVSSLPDEAEDADGADEAPEISFATESAIPSGSVPLSSIRGAHERGAEAASAAFSPSPQPRERLGMSAHLGSRGVPAGLVQSPHARDDRGTERSGDVDDGMVVEAGSPLMYELAPAIQEVISPAQTPADDRAHAREGWGELLRSSLRHETASPTSTGMSVPLQRLTDLDRRTGETIEQLEARLQSLLDASKWSSREHSEASSGKSRRDASATPTSRPREDAGPSRGAEEGDQEAAGTGDAADARDVSAILTRAQLGEDLDMGDIDRLTRKLKSMRDETRARGAQGL